MAKARSHPRMVVPLRATVIALAAVAVVWAGHTAWAAFKNRGTPSCSWALRVGGKPTPVQAGLIRCYLRALAHRDAAGLLAVAANIPPVRITKADFAHSADARAGLATAIFTPNPSDSSSASVAITYADGARAQVGILNMISMGGPSYWRIDGVGTLAHPGSPGPSPANPPGPSPASTSR
jgi:hypothetical protein